MAEGTSGSGLRRLWITAGVIRRKRVSCGQAGHGGNKKTDENKAGHMDYTSKGARWILCLAIALGALGAGLAHAATLSLDVGRQGCRNQ